MTATWATEAALERALAELAERYPDEMIEIIETFDVAWPGWAGDNMGAIVRRGTGIDLVIIDGSYVTADPPLFEQLIKLIGDLHVQAAAIAAVLQRYARGNFDAATGEIAPYFGSAGAEERALEVLRGIADAGGRIALDVGDLTPAELDRIADSEIPAELQWTVERADAARAEIAEIVDRLPPHLLERARDAVRDVEIEHKLGKGGDE